MLTLYIAETVCIVFLGLEFDNSLNWIINFFLGSTSSSGPWSLLCWGNAISLRYSTLSRTPLDEWSAHRRDLYLSTHNIHNRQKSMPPVGFELAIPASEWPHTQASGRGDSRIG